MGEIAEQLFSSFTAWKEVVHSIRTFQLYAKLLGKTDNLWEDRELFPRAFR